jgi:hypothetical protein
MYQPKSDFIYGKMHRKQRFMEKNKVIYSDGPESGKEGGT